MTRFLFRGCEYLKNKTPLAASLIPKYSDLTEFIEIKEMNELTPIQQKFILHWGEMGTKWGINRTVAQVHALLYVWPEPLNADDITQTLSVARSNVSTSLKAVSYTHLTLPTKRIV